MLSRNNYIKIQKNIFITGIHWVIRDTWKNIQKQFCRNIYKTEKNRRSINKGHNYTYHLKIVVKETAIFYM